MIPRRTAIVTCVPGSGSFGDTDDARYRRQAFVTLPRLPWEPDITEPDPRTETAPRAGAIRNPDLDETRGPWAPARPVRR
jgi:hypothetical protein